MFLTIDRTRKGESRTTAEILAILDGQGVYSQSGALVTSATALQQATVWACVRTLSEVVAQLPVMVQTRNDDGQWMNAPDHGVLRVVHEPNDWQTSHEYIAHLMTWSELRGNAYYYKATDARGRVMRMYPLRADDVEAKPTNNFSMVYTVGGNSRLQGRQLAASEMFHLRNFGSDGYMGLSTIENLRNSIGLALTTEQHGSNLFKNGAQPGLMITAPSATQDQVEALQKKLDDKYTGAGKSHKTMIMRGDMTAQKISMTQGDAQFLETRHFSKQEIASAFGVPMFILNDTQKATTWGTGLEQQLRAFKTISLAPRLNRLAQTMARELLGRNEKRMTRFMFDTDALTLGDFKDRMDGYRAGIESGVLSPNEAREVEGRNPREGGNEFRQPANIQTEGQGDAEAD
jgi:HK97 family phage portal protein